MRVEVGILHRYLPSCKGLRLQGTQAHLRIPAASTGIGPSLLPLHGDHSSHKLIIYMVPVLDSSVHTRTLQFPAPQIWNSVLECYLAAGHTHEALLPCRC